MSGVIDPEAAEPSIPQAFEQSDRNPTVVLLGGNDADGGQIASPADFGEPRDSAWPGAFAECRVAGL